MSHSTNDNILSMLSSPRVLLTLLAACSILGSACGSGGGILGNEYEYEEELRLYVDGSAQMDLSSSIAALVALRGLDLDPNPDLDVDRDQVRSMFRGPGVDVRSVRVSRRDGRRFVHVRVDGSDIRQLSGVAPFSWSSYQFRRRGDVLEYQQVIGAAVGKVVGDVGWNGNERVAFRVHIPSVIAYHNAPSKQVRRGNILEWEQPLVERLKSVPVQVEVNMEPDSILYTTLWLFGSMILLAAVVFGVVIWWVARHGREDVEPGPLTSTRPTPSP
jgi:hypothetical protein